MVCHRKAGPPAQRGKLTAGRGALYLFLFFFDPPKRIDIPPPTRFSPFGLIRLGADPPASTYTPLPVFLFSIVARPPLAVFSVLIDTFESFFATVPPKVLCTQRGSYHLKFAVFKYRYHRKQLNESFLQHQSIHSVDWPTFRFLEDGLHRSFRGWIVVRVRHLPWPSGTQSCDACSYGSFPHTSKSATGCSSQTVARQHNPVAPLRPQSCEET